MGGDTRKREKIKSAMKFVKRIKKVYEEAGAALKKVQEEMKRYVDKKQRNRRKEIE